jgi:hypothetical protein
MGPIGVQRASGAAFAWPSCLNWAPMRWSCRQPWVAVSFDPATRGLLFVDAWPDQGALRGDLPITSPNRGRAQRVISCSQPSGPRVLFICHEKSVSRLIYGLIDNGFHASTTSWPVSATPDETHGILETKAELTGSGCDVDIRAEIRDRRRRRCCEYPLKMPSSNIEYLWLMDSRICIRLL